MVKHWSHLTVLDNIDTDMDQFKKDPTRKVKKLKRGKANKAKAPKKRLGLRAPKAKAPKLVGNVFLSIQKLRQHPSCIISLHPVPAGRDLLGLLRSQRHQPAH